MVFFGGEAFTLRGGASSKDIAVFARCSLPLLRNRSHQRTINQISDPATTRSQRQRTFSTNTIAIRLISCSKVAGTLRARSYSFSASNRGVSTPCTRFVSAAASWRAVVTPIAGGRVVVRQRRKRRENEAAWHCTTSSVGNGRKYECRVR